MFSFFHFLVRVAKDLRHDLLNATASKLRLFLLHDGLLRGHWLSIVGLDLLAEVIVVVFLPFPDHNSNLAFLLEEEAHPALLFADEGHLV